MHARHSPDCDLLTLYGGNVRLSFLLKPVFFFFLKLPGPTVSHLLCFLVGPFFEFARSAISTPLVLLRVNPMWLTAAQAPCYHQLSGFF